MNMINDKNTVKRLCKNCTGTIVGPHIEGCCDEECWHQFRLKEKCKSLGNTNSGPNVIKRCRLKFCRKCGIVIDDDRKTEFCSNFCSRNYYIAKYMGRKGDNSCTVYNCVKKHRIYLDNVIIKLKNMLEIHYEIEYEDISRVVKNVTLDETVFEYIKFKKGRIYTKRLNYLKEIIDEMNGVIVIGDLKRLISIIINIYLYPESMLLKKL